MRITMLKIHLEILDKQRQETFAKLVAFKNDGCLAGGTALSLQINHRRSVDFDIFLPKPIPQQFFHRVTEVFGKDTKAKLNTSDLLLIETPQKIDVHFVFFWYKRLFSTIKTPSVDLEAVGDIAANKAHTLGRRAVWRDYADLFFLLKNKQTALEKIIKDAKKKFGGEFVETQFLEQLCYFKDLTVSPIEWIGISYSPEEIKSFLGKQVEEYLKKNFKI